MLALDRGFLPGLTWAMLGSRRTAMPSRTIKVTGVSEELLQTLDQRIRAPVRGRALGLHPRADPKRCAGRGGEWRARTLGRWTHGHEGQMLSPEGRGAVGPAPMLPR